MNKSEKREVFRELKKRMKFSTASGPNVPPSPCPHCGYLSDTAQIMGEEASRPVPKESAVVCINCGEINGYDAKLHLVKLNPMELLRFQRYPVAGPILSDLCEIVLQAKHLRENQ